LQRCQQIGRGNKDRTPNGHGVSICNCRFVTSPSAIC
jgi:hypothetical protein